MNAPERNSQPCAGTIVVACAGSPHPAVPWSSNSAPRQPSPDQAGPGTPDCPRGPALCRGVHCSQRLYRPGTFPGHYTVLREAADSGSWSTIRSAAQSLAASGRSASCYESRGERFVEPSSRGNRPIVRRAMRLPRGGSKIPSCPRTMDLHAAINVGGETIVPCGYRLNARLISSLKCNNSPQRS